MTRQRPSWQESLREMLRRSRREINLTLVIAPRGWQGKVKRLCTRNNLSLSAISCGYWIREEGRPQFW